VNLGGWDGSESAYEPQYFFLPLWASDFSPLGFDLGIIDWFTLIGLGGVGDAHHPRRQLGDPQNPQQHQ
jgi:hypothetical protein